MEADERVGTTAENTFGILSRVIESMESAQKNLEEAFRITGGAFWVVEGVAGIIGGGSGIFGVGDSGGWICFGMG